MEQLSFGYYQSSSLSLNHPSQQDSAEMIRILLDSQLYLSPYQLCNLEKHWLSAAWIALHIDDGLDGIFDIRGAGKAVVCHAVTFVTDLPAVRGTASASASASASGSPLDVTPTTPDLPLLQTRLPLVPCWRAT